MIVVIFLLIFGGKWDNNQIGPKFGLPEHLPQRPYLPLQNLLVLHHIHLVQHHYQLLHKQFRYYYALCCLRLDPLCRVNYQKHYVYYLCPAYDRSYERCVAGAVNEGELQVLLL